MADRTATLARRSETLDQKNTLIRLNREYKQLTGHVYFIRTEPSGAKGRGTKWVFGDVSVYSLDAALATMREGLETARRANVR